MGIVLKESDCVLFTLILLQNELLDAFDTAMSLSFPSAEIFSSSNIRRLKLLHLNRHDHIT